METLLILRFWEIIKTDNQLLLDSNYSPDKVYTESEKIKIKETWNSLYDEYYQEKNDKEAAYFLKLNSEKNAIIFLIILLEDIQNRFALLLEMDGVMNITWILEKKTELYKELKQYCPKARINQFDSIPELIENVTSLLKSYQNIFNEKNNVVEKKVEKKKISIHRIVARIGRALMMQLNVENMSCASFLEYERMAIELNKQE